jgi:hypothetical protein
MTFPLVDWLWSLSQVYIQLDKREINGKFCSENYSHTPMQRTK